MSLKVTPRENNFGAEITGINLCEPLGGSLAEELKEAWYQHQVLYFPDQNIDHNDLESFTEAIGPYGIEPYVKTLDDHPHIIEVRRDPHEKIAPFGGSWHSDWSFQEQPPSATILHAKVVPPIGGDTHFADGIRAYEELDEAIRTEIDEMEAIHSARRPYSHEGYKLGGDRTSMTVLPSDDAYATQKHPVVRTHPESKRKTLWINPVYTLAIDGLSDSASKSLLAKLFEHLLQDEFILKLKWAKNMLTMWDNRSVLHCAQGGYEGHLRIMHRTTVAGSKPF